MNTEWAFIITRLAICMLKNDEKYIKHFIAYNNFNFVPSQKHFTLLSFFRSTVLP